MLKFKLLSIFPDIFDSYLNESIIKRAQKQKIISVKSYDLRKWTTDKHQSVDDSPYGGGAGMLLKIEPLYRALKYLNKNPKEKTYKRKVVLLSASGQTWTQAKAQKYSKLEELILISGRYEGVDARIKNFIDEEISIGNYVLTGGELASLVILDSITRLLPGALGNQASTKDESYSEIKVLEYPQYTRPAIFKADHKNYSVPKILLSGNHAAIKKWQQDHRRQIS